MCWQGTGQSTLPILMVSFDKKEAFHINTVQLIILFVVRLERYFPVCPKVSKMFSCIFPLKDG